MQRDSDATGTKRVMGEASASSGAGHKVANQAGKFRCLGTCRPAGLEVEMMMMGGMSLIVVFLTLTGDPYYNEYRD